MTIKHIVSSAYLIAISCMLSACSDQHSDHIDERSAHDHNEKPIQHLKLEDIYSLEKASAVFAKEVDFIIGKEELTAGVLHEIHMSTYSLEKAVAYFVENSEA